MRIHLIPNSHIDPVWLWDQYEGIDEVLNTFRSACDRLDEYPELTFSASSARFYAWVLEHDPGLFERIYKFVAAGRWEIVGDWWVEADTNLSGGVGLHRQSEMGRDFLRSRFGSYSPVAFLPDTFGHPADLPKLLAESGFRYLIFCRPSESEKDDLPGNLFYWNYGRHRVLAYRLKHHYFQEDTTDEQRLARLADDEYAQQPVNAFLFGLGDHGGGPTIEEIECFRSYIDSSPRGHAGFSSCERFFAEAERAGHIPHYEGDLHMHAVGCYSVVREVKQLVRRGERALSQAERASMMLGERAPGLEESWRSLLFNQFHDILPGSMSPEAGRQAVNELGGVVHEAERETYGSLKQLSMRTPASVREGEFRVFNTLPHPITVPISIESFPYYRPGAAFRDSSGREVTIQEIPAESRCITRRWTFVDSLPARGCNSYHFDSTSVVERAVAGNFSPDEHPERADRVPWLDNVGMTLLVLDDSSDTWSHGAKGFNDVVGAFRREQCSIHSGPVAESRFSRWSFGGSECDIVFTRMTGLAGIYVDIRVRWVEKRRILKLELRPPNGVEAGLEMQGAVGMIIRNSDGRELPMHGWLRTIGKDGFTVVQDGVFACDATADAVRLTLVRSSLYGYDEKTKLSDADPVRHTDQGEHHFRLWFGAAPEDGVDDLNRHFEAFVERLFVIRETPRARSQSGS
ncbi:MAG: hypothetical protein R2832_14250 [Rhodothermales bacterium]